MSIPGGPCTVSDAAAQMHHTTGRWLRSLVLGHHLTDVACTERSGRRTHTVAQPEVVALRVLKVVVISGTQVSIGPPAAAHR
jgi:hypothetical protein